MPKKPKLPRVGPTLYPAKGFPQARVSVRVSPGSCRGAKNRKPGRLFHERVDPYNVFNTSPYNNKGVRSSKKDAAISLAKRKAEIQLKYKEVRNEI